MTSTVRLDTFSILLYGQADEAPALSGGAPPTGTEAADGSGAPAAAAPGGFGDMFIIFIPVVLVMLFISMMGSRRDKKRRAQLQKIVKHDRIRTRGGIIGSVIEAKDNELVIKVDESRDTRITLDRQYVDAVLEGDDSTKN